MDSNQLQFCRCREWQTIRELLARDYYDSPVCYFPNRTTRAAAKWLSESESVYFFTAEHAGAVAGFVFAHLLGPTIWRNFAARHPLHFLELAYVAVARSLGLRSASVAQRYAHARPIAASPKVDDLDLPAVDAPFYWSQPDFHTAYIDMVYVCQHFRGRGYASTMLQLTTQSLLHDGIDRIEAHIDAANYSSVRAFLKANWRVVRTASNDLKAEYADSRDQ